ncbi:MAG: mechanosensitive ion channel domain-containing protein [Candidatus Hydrogenedentota bacterium]
MKLHRWSWGKRPFGFSLICLAMIFAMPAWSQPGNWGEPQTPQAEGVVVSAGASPEEMTPIQQAKKMVDLSSPRNTVTSFLKVMGAAKEGRAEFQTAALQCIRILELPEDERISLGSKLAQEIYEALTSITVNMDVLDDAPENPTTDRDRVYEREVGETTKVALSFKFNDDGVWRFSYTVMANQEDALEQVVEVAEAAAEEVVVDSRVNERLANPRETMQTFLNAFKEGLWDDGGRDQAILTLDLSDVPNNLHIERGEELAALLKKILDRHEVIVVEAISNAPDGLVHVVLVDPTDDFEQRKIEIVPVPIEEGSEVVEWRFSKGSLELLADMWANYYVDQEVVAGFQSEAPEVLSLQLSDWVAKNAPYLMGKFISIEYYKWIGLLLSIILGMVVSRIIAAILLLIVRRVFSREHFQLDKKLEVGFVFPVRIGIMCWVWWLALKPLSLPPDALTWLKTAIVTVSSSAFVWAVYRLVDIFGSYITDKSLRSDNKYDDMVVPLIVRSLKVFVICAGFIFVAEMNEWDYLPALAGFGLLGMALALAAQDTLGNVFGSLTVLMDRPFQIGDWVQIDDVDGNVESVGIRSTRIRTFYNSVVTVPNSALTTAVIDNYGQRRYRRIKMDINITYDTPPEKIDAFCEGIRELIRQHPYTRTDYFHVYLNDFGPSSLDILLYCFLECPEWSTELRERHRLLLDIIRLAKNLGVEFAFPTSTLYMQQAATVDGDPGGNITHESALEDGRKHARGIVEKYLGKNAPTPPPVSFRIASMNEGEAEDDGDDGGDGD